MKLLNTGIVIMAVGAVGTILAIAMEIQTAEPIYMIFMKVTAGLFGVGGGLMGLSALRKK